MERLDLVVIGAGWYGLAAAKQYFQQHPDEHMAVLDSSASIGGVWAEERLYPGLKSNNLLGTYEYPDFPMDPQTFGVQPGQHIPGEVIHAYQVAYANKFALHDRIRLNTKVVSAEHQTEGGWILKARRADQNETDLFTKRLIVATGLISEPFMPHIQGQETYNRPLFHSRDFGRYLGTIDPEKTKRVTVFGGTKSAWDAVYAYSTKGVKVDWIIRESGHGPGWMAPPYVTPLKKWLEKLVNTRMLHWFAPCIWGEDSGYTAIKRFWHGTALGRALTDSFWTVLANDVMQLMGFDQHPECRKLAPTSEAMFTGASFSILNYDGDFFAPIRSGQVKVHIADVSHLAPGRVHLDDAARTVLDSDAMMCVTGWKHVPPLKFLPEGIERKLGLSHVPSDDERHLPPDEGLGCQTSLLAQADAEILAKFPRLKVPMKFNPKYVPITQTRAFSAPASDDVSPASPATPMMLYHFLVPGTAAFLRTKDVAFAGAIANFSNIICAHVQGLWISAYFDGKLARDPSAAVQATPLKAGSGSRSSDSLTLDQVHYETVLHNRFGKWRYPNDPGSKHPDFVFEAVPYLDLLMADLGLKVHRKGGWLKEATSPYGPEDYQDINEEWAAKYAAESA